MLGVGWKIILLLKGAFPFNADEAIVGLMGRHILTGARPVFFYGQAYMGSLDAMLVAAGFQIFGSQVWVIRFIQVVIYAGVLGTTMVLAQRLRNRVHAVLLSGLLLAIPTVNFTLYTTVSLGGYGEALLVGNLIILLTIHIIRRKDPEHIKYLLWGFLVGLGFWGFSISMVYSIPCAAALVWRIKQQGGGRREFGRLAPVLIGLSIGALPVLSWSLYNEPGVLLNELFGSAIAGASSQKLWESSLAHLLNFILFGPSVILGLRPPWSSAALALPLLPLAVIFWFPVLLHALRRYRIKEGLDVYIILAGMAVILIAAFIFSPFGADPSGRYFVPLMIPLAIMGGDFLTSPNMRIGKIVRMLMLIGVLAFNVFGTWQAANADPDRLSTQFDPVARVDHGHMGDLISFLQEQGESHGYTNYWIAYPLAFLSGETLIYQPSLPYHLDFRYTSRDNRYPTYEKIVEESDRTAFITSNHDALDESLRISLSRLQVSWSERQIGDYNVFYGLSRRVGIAEVAQDWLSSIP